MDNLEKYDKILFSVKKPGRYIGGEIGSHKKRFSDFESTLAFCFPDVYEVGMSHLGLQILYGLINKEEDLLMDRCFMPWFDMLDLMKENNLPIVTLESKKSLREYSMVAFTLQYEMSFTNILKMLDECDIPLRRADRYDSDNLPLIIGGGPCAVNPAPLKNIFDIFLIGDGEESFLKILKVLKKYTSNHYVPKDKKEAFYEEISLIDGVYIPHLQEQEKNKGTYRVKRAIVRDLEKAYYPESFIVPFIDAVHDRVMLEVLRGCTHGCRFCQAGMIYRPVRERNKETLLGYGEKLINQSGHNDISLTSLSTADYTNISELIDDLIEKYEEKKISISLPSLRVDTFSVGLAQKIQKVRKTGFTFAPEAGTQRMRDIINKGVNEEDIYRSLTSAFENGWKRVKLYFMIGLPFETDEDIKGIMDLGEEIAALGKKISGRGDIRVTVSVSSFVPKPFTPFQYFKQNTHEELNRKQEILKNNKRSKNVTLNYHEVDVSLLEGLFARGDASVGEVLLKAYEKGCIFDSWSEKFNHEAWMEALSEANVYFEDINLREYTKDEELPWDFIDIGTSKNYLYGEYEKAKSCDTTKDCRTGCTGCELCDFKELKNDLRGEYHG